MDLFGWDPHSRASVRDLAERVPRKNGTLKITRFHPSFLRDRLAEGCPEEILQKADREFCDILAHFTDSTLEEVAMQALDWLIGFEDLDPGYRDSLIQLKENGFRVVPYPGGKPCVLSGFFLAPKLLRTRQDEDDRSSLSRRVMLRVHEEHVEEQIKEFATLLKIPPDIAEDLALAARTHDLGKTDPRFQVWLRGGLPVGLKGEEALAKSDMNSFDRNRIAAARIVSGYPAGGRHEMTSVGLLNHYPELLSEAHDKMLVKYLVGSHHGRGRPFMPVVEDEGVESVAVWNGRRLTLSLPYGLEGLGSGWTDMFWALVRRYGWWTLSYLETLLRLADQQQSEKEMSQ
jgi:CRISPR-associated endonuclease/helicase Cas3